MIESVYVILETKEDQLALLIEMFLDRLPDYIRNKLTRVALAIWIFYLIAYNIEFSSYEAHFAMGSFSNYMIGD